MPHRGALRAVREALTQVSRLRGKAPQGALPPPRALGAVGAVTADVPLLPAGLRHGALPLSRAPFRGCAVLARVSHLPREADGLPRRRRRRHAALRRVLERLWRALRQASRSPVAVRGQHAAARGLPPTVPQLLGPPRTVLRSAGTFRPGPRAARPGARDGRPAAGARRLRR